MTHFTVTFSHLHFRVIQRGFDAILDKNNKTAPNCLTYSPDYIAMLMKKTVTVKRAISVLFNVYNTDVFFWRNFQSNFFGKSYFTSAPILYLYMFTHSIV